MECKCVDWIVVNDVSLEMGIMGGDVNMVWLVSYIGVENWFVMDKMVVVC